MQKRNFNFSNFLLLGVFFCLIGLLGYTNRVYIPGIMNACIARNLAQDIGTLWMPHYTDTHLSEFFIHPPLMFWILSTFYRLFGDLIWIEKLFSLGCILINTFIIQSIWNKITTSQNNWIPTFIWLSYPVIMWSSTDNAVENVLVIFCTLSIYFYLKSIHQFRILNLIFSGICVFLAFMVHGTSGIFILTFPVIYRIFEPNRDLRNSLKDLLWIYASFLVPILSGYFLVPEARQNILNYFRLQEIILVQNYLSIHNSLKIVIQIFFEILPVVIINLIVFFWTRFRRHSSEFINRRYFIIFSLTTLVGLISLILHRNYEEHSVILILPFWTIANGLLLDHYFENIQLRPIRIKQIVSSMISIIIFVCGLFFISYKISRPVQENEKNLEVRNLINNIPPHTTIRTCTELKSDFEFEAYFARFKNISLNDQGDYPVIVQSKKCRFPAAHPYDTLIFTPNKTYRLFKAASY